MGITLYDLNEMIISLVGASAKPEEIRDLMNWHDKNNDHYLNYEEFIDLIL